MAALVMGLAPAARAQSPLRQCVGGKSLFAVSGDTLSTFRYSITGGEFLTTAKPDSVVVKWGLHKGQYKVGVQEIANAGCEGGWVYQDVELVGTPFYFPKNVRRICPGDTMYIPIDRRLYTTHRWSDPRVDTRGIVEPGGYRIWVEDTNGCKFTDSITVVTCQPTAVFKAARRTP